MSSVLTNTAALTALQTLKLTNQSLEDSSNRVATGLKINTAKDGAAYWSIATSLSSDNSVIGAVKQGLGLGGNAVNVAAEGLSQAGKLLTDLQTQLSTALTPGTDRFKIQKQIDADLSQLKQVAIGAAQGGESWLSVDSTTGNGYQNVRKIVSSFTRVQGNIQIDNIEVNLDEVKLYDKNNVSDAKAGKDADTKAWDDYKTATTTYNTAEQAYKDSKKTDADLTTWKTAQDTYTTATTTFNTGRDTANDAATAGTDSTTGGLADKKFAVFGVDEHGFKKQYQVSVTDINVTTSQDSDLSKIRAFVALVDKVQKKVQDASSKLGSVQSQVQSQQNFIDTLTKANKTSVSTLVDADMEDESSRLKALQVQQQLGVQSLSIANQSTQQILSLFRG